MPQQQPTFYGWPRTRRSTSCHVVCSFLLLFGSTRQGFEVPLFFTIFVSFSFLVCILIQSALHSHKCYCPLSLSLRRSYHASHTHRALSPTDECIFRMRRRMRRDFALRSKHHSAVRQPKRKEKQFHFVIFVPCFHVSSSSNISTLAFRWKRG